MNKIIITLVGSGLIAAIYWFFFAKKDDTVEATEALTIIVDGGYKPNTIKVNRNKPVILTFLRKDPTECLEEVFFPDYKMKEYLPLNKPVTITLSPPHSTISGFHCSMNMFHGKIKIN